LLRKGNNIFKPSISGHLKKLSYYLPGKVSRHIVPALILTLLIINCSLFTGCGIFDTRDPEDPETIRSTYVPPTSPELVIDNLSFSIQEKNSVNYNKCISDQQYVYVPDSKSQLNYSEIFQGWNKSSEKRYIDNLISRTNATATSVLFIDNENLTLITPDSAVYSAQYIVVFQHNQANVPKSAKGNITVYLSSDENNLFYIKRWEDFRQNDNDFTWSELKANFY
jgi:hypothetical protein